MDLGRALIVRGSRVYSLPYVNNPSEISRHTATILDEIRRILTSPHPDLAEAIRATADVACNQHVIELRANIPEAATLNREEALDDLPKVLRALADAFAFPDNLEGLRNLGPAHAAARDGQGFTLAEVMREYAMFRRSLRSHVERHLARPLRNDEAQVFQGAIDGLVGLSVLSFTGQRETRLQLETTALANFLSSAAHDLRNEVNGVTVSLQLLEEIGRDIQKELTQSSSTATDFAAKKLDEFLHETRACRGTMDSTIAAMTLLLEAERIRTRVTPTFRPVPLAALMQGVARSAGRIGYAADQPRTDDEPTRIQPSCPADLVVWTDPDLLSSVLVNLLGNAVKHAPDGTIHFFASTLNHSQCRITIRDEGPGIPPERLEKLFDKFQRGETSSHGLGLGLFIARRAAELLKSKIDVESEMGAGSSFRIDVPTSPPPVAT
jgi:signal transduction histidine kinase